jgi:hypothetical protein
MESIGTFPAIPNLGTLLTILASLMPRPFCPQVISEKRFPVSTVWSSWILHSAWILWKREKDFSPPGIEPSYLALPVPSLVTTRTGYAIRAPVNLT